MKGWRRALGALSIALVLVFHLGACASKPPPPAVIRGTIDGAPDINPNAQGRPSPVVIKLFELKTVGLFDAADFFALFEREREALGAELVAREEYQLKPGDKLVLQRTLQPDTRYVGIVAAYRDLEGSRWRASVPVPPHQTTPMVVRVDARAVSIRSN